MYIARTITVDLGHELRDFIEYLIESGDYRTQSEVIRESLRLLREKQAESRLQTLRNLLAEGLSSGEPVVWEKDTFLKKLKQAQSLPVKTLNSHLKPVRILRISGITATTIFGEERADRYINQLSAFCFGVLIISVLPVLNWGIHIGTTR